MKKISYEYKVQSMGQDGYSLVEYKTDKLGSRTLSIYLPYDNPEQTKSKIIEHFPVEYFYSQWLRRFELWPENFGLRGEGTIDLDDWFISTCNADS